MPVNSKPFDFGDRLYRSVFKGRPNVFSSQDLNRYLDALREAQNGVSSLIGPGRTNFNFSVAGYTETPGTGVTTAAFNYSLTIPEPLEDSYVTYKGIRFPIEAASGSFTFDYPDPFQFGAYLCLVATRKTVSFNSTPPVLHITDAQEFSGVTGGEIVPALPGADNEIYGAERVVVTSDPTSIVLGTDEEFICILATVRKVKVYSGSASVFPDALDNAPFVVWNCFETASEIFKVPYIVPGTPSLTPLADYYSFLHNGSLWDFLVHWFYNFVYGQSQQDSRLNDHDTLLDSLTTTVDGAVADVTALDARVDAVEDVNDSQGTALTSVQNTITSLNATINALNATVNSQAAKVLALEAATTVQVHTVASINTAGYSIAPANPVTAKKVLNYVTIEGEVRGPGETTALVELFVLPDSYKPTVDKSFVVGNFFRDLFLVTIDTDGIVRGQPALGFDDWYGDEPNKGLILDCTYTI